jgi:hypothetical protein
MIGCFFHSPFKPVKVNRLYQVINGTRVPGVPPVAVPEPELVVMVAASFCRSWLREPWRLFPRPLTGFLKPLFFPLYARFLVSDVTFYQRKV